MHSKKTLIKFGFAEGDGVGLVPLIIIDREKKKCSWVSSEGERPNCSF